MIFNFQCWHCSNDSTKIFLFLFFWQQMSFYVYENAHIYRTMENQFPNLVHLSVTNIDLPEEKPPSSSSYPEKVTECRGARDSTPEYSLTFIIAVTSWCHMMAWRRTSPQKLSSLVDSAFPGGRANHTGGTNLLIWHNFAKNYMEINLKIGLRGGHASLMLPRSAISHIPKLQII